jgi:acetate kinase
MRELLEAERQGDHRAGLAVEMFCYRVRKYIGAYLSVLGGAHAVVFGGGIGENAPTVRARICAGMDWCGLTLDQHRNAAAIGVEERISADYAKVHAYVIPVDEAVIIARDTVSCLAATSGAGE